MANISIFTIPTATFILNPNYNGLLIFNFIICMIGLTTLIFKNKINSFLKKQEEINIDSFDIIEVLFRMMMLVNVGFFMYQFFIGFMFPLEEIRLCVYP